MRTSNTQLSNSLQKNIKFMIDYNAYALGVEKETPIFALKLPQERSDILDSTTLGCEFKPTMININYYGHTFALCIVQFRLDGDDELIFNTCLHLTQKKDYKIAHGLLRMQEYDTIILTNKMHRAIEYKANFVGTFDPRIVLKQTLENANVDDRALSQEVYLGISSQFESGAKMWYGLEKIAPAHNRWYIRM